MEVQINQHQTEQNNVVVPQQTNTTNTNSLKRGRIIKRKKVKNETADKLDGEVGISNTVVLNENKGKKYKKCETPACEGHGNKKEKEKEVFVIPTIYEDDKITMKLSLSQMKDICRHHRVMVTGNKTILYDRIKTYFKSVKALINIQSCMRRMNAQTMIKLHGPALHNRSICVNDMDIMGTDLIDIPMDYFYSFTDQGFTYGFDVVSFMKLIQDNKSSKKTKNPYTRDNIDEVIISEFYQLLRQMKLHNREIKFDYSHNEDDNNNTFESNDTLQHQLHNQTQGQTHGQLTTSVSHINQSNNTSLGLGNITDQLNNSNVNIIITETNNSVLNITISQTQDTYEHTLTITPLQIEHGIFDVFNEIDRHGHYTDANWVINLTVERLRIFIKEMCDIFSYRAGLTDSVKRNIIPPRGQIGEVNLRQWLIVTNDINHLRLKALKIMRKLIFYGLTDNDKALGTFYVLTALTIASSQAAQAMPWLYQSAL